MRYIRISLIFLIAISLTACATKNQNNAEITDVPIVTKSAENVVIAEAVLKAAEKRMLSFESSGVLLEIMIDEGVNVKKGELLAVLNPTDAELAVRQAETGLQQAEAQLARMVAGPRETDIAVVQTQLLSAQSVISQTIAQRDQLFTGTTDAQIAAAEADLATALAQRVVALKQHDDTMKCYDVPGSDDKVCPALGDPEEKARYALYAAEKGLAAAEAQLAALEPAARAQIRTANAGISVAEVQEMMAAAQLDQLLAGASAEEIEAMVASVEQAMVTLDMAKLALTRTALYAPFDGTITAVYADPGDPVAFGQPLINIATTQKLQVQTIDLTELNVVKLKIGQNVDVVMDALPDLVLTGHITEIGMEAVDYRGDVTYPVLIDLDDSESRLRLGMTAEVTIPIP